MKKKLITLEFNEEKESITEDAFSIAESYDHYVGAIDDGTEYRNAIQSNKEKLKKLKDLDVISVTWHDHVEMFSTTVEDKTFNLID